MKKTNARSKRTSDADIERFCQSVEEILTGIKDKRRRGRKKKTKEDSFPPLKDDLLTFSQ